MTAAVIENIKALVVDDHLLLRRHMDRMLKDMGFSHVDQASTANEAADKMSAVGYDVIFIDWYMPGKSGYNLMQTFREDRKYDGVAFVIVSAESEERFIGEAMKAGATAYIVKPVTESALHDTVGKLLDWLEKRRGKLQDGVAT